MESGTGLPGPDRNRPYPNRNRRKREEVPSKQGRTPDAGPKGPEVRIRTIRSTDDRGLGPGRRVLRESEGRREGVSPSTRRRGYPEVTRVRFCNERVRILTKGGAQERASTSNSFLKRVVNNRPGLWSRRTRLSGVDPAVPRRDWTRRPVSAWGLTGDGEWTLVEVVCVVGFPRRGPNRRTLSSSLHRSQEWGFGSRRS